MDNISNSEHPLENDASNISNEENILRQRSLSIQSRRSWPLLPTLQVINSNESASGNNRFTITSPIIEENNIINQVADDNSSYSSNSSISEDEDEIEKVDTSRRCDTTQKDETRRSSTGTLVEAALDHVQARDRHVRFTEHIAEAGNLVERMLSTTRHTAQYSNKNVNQEASTYDNIDDLELQTSRSPTSNYSVEQSGSVLASLMKLEAHKKQPSIKRRKTTRKKESTKKKTPKIRKPASMYNLKLQSSLDAINTTQQKNNPSRPDTISRPPSWLSTFTSSNPIVPTLQKRKLASSVSMSRRSSMDSMFTTASQFEPITLEDRIRITFEIANILQKQEFLRKLVKCLMLYGAPAHRLEYILREVSRTLGVNAEYVYMPNIMFLTFYDQSTHTTETHFIRSAQLFDMDKLSEIYRLEKLVSHGEVSVDEALEFIDTVANAPQLYPIWLNPFIYALASFCGCVMFFGGQWKEGGLSAAFAIFFALIEMFSGRYVSFQPIWEITICILIGFVSRALWKYEFCFTPVAFASFIVILPGYSMTTALIELVSRQLVSGVVRMVYAIMYAFLLGYGIEMGSELFGTISPESISAQGQSPNCVAATTSTACVTMVPQVYYFLTVPLFAVAYCIYLRAKLHRWPVMIIVAICGFVTNYALSCYAKAPTQVLQVVPAFVVGLLGNLISKFTGNMCLDAVILGIFYLVPGSLGLKAALGFFGNPASSEFANQGAGFSLSMIETAIGITVGLFVATLLVYPKGTQHTPLMNF